MTSRWMFGVALLGTLGVVRPATAQKGARMAPARQVLLETINRRFMNQVIKEMALTPEQVPRFQRVVLSWAQKRAGLEDEERRLHQALTGDELRPGVAANPESVTREVDGINAVRVKYAEAMRDEMLELAPILSPVQRGQFQIRRDQFLQRVRDLQQQRPGGAATTPGGP